MFTPFVANTEVSKKTVIFSVFTGKTPGGVIALAKPVTAATKVKEPALILKSDDK